MLAYPTNDKKQRPLSRMVSYVLLSLIFLWTFVGTIDGPTVSFGKDTGSVVYKAPKALTREHGVRTETLWFGILPEEPSPVHASFLLFDFKQNLRRWPNVAGDISRSPPFFLAL
jgi:hypothetical protein